MLGPSPHPFPNGSSLRGRGGGGGHNNTLVPLVPNYRDLDYLDYPDQCPRPRHWLPQSLAFAEGMQGGNGSRESKRTRLWWERRSNDTCPSVVDRSSWSQSRGGATCITQNVVCIPLNVAAQGEGGHVRARGQPPAGSVRAVCHTSAADA